MKYFIYSVVIILITSFCATFWIGESGYQDLSLSVHTRRAKPCSMNRPDFSGKDGLIIRKNFYDPKKLREFNYGECTNNINSIEDRKKMYSFLRKGDHINYVKCMNRSVDRLDPLSMCDLGLIYFSRSDRDLYQSEIFYLWSSAANSLGSGVTLSNLGLLYEMGLGVDKNLTAAEILYQNSLLLGEESGYRNLAILYDLNKLQPVPPVTLWFLYEKAAIMGDYYASRKILFQNDKY